MESSTAYLLIFIAALLGAVVSGLLVWWSGRAYRQRAQDSRVQIERLDERLSNLSTEKSLLDTRLTELDSDLDSERRARMQQESLNRGLQERLRQEQSERGELHSKMTKDFALLSNRILEENSKKFSLQNKEQMDAILQPLKERIDTFQKKVEDTHEKSQKARHELHTKVLMLHEAHQALSTEAQNLTAALKGDNKTQGNWGELILEKVLERSNLRKGEEYETQYSTTDESGKRQLPDFIVKLPDGKHLIIDSKVSLVNYTNYLDDSLSAEEQAGQLKLHIISVKNHIRELNKKNYQDAKGVNSPDFVLMFMPIEASFALAVQEDKELFDYAWERKIVVVSPSTLLATLRTVSSLWKQERQNRNSELIASHAASLYDKFVGFVDDLQKVRTHLDRSIGAYDDSMSKLSSGRGNLVRQVERLRDLGVKGKKALGEELLDRSEEKDHINQTKSLSTNE